MSQEKLGLQPRGGNAFFCEEFRAAIQSIQDGHWQEVTAPGVDFTVKASRVESCGGGTVRDKNEAPMATVSPPTLRLRVTAAAERSIRRGHPWVFAESVNEQNRAGNLGEVAVVYDRQDKFLAAGLFDPDSPIRARILHAGKPARIDAAWLAGKMAEAFARREGMFDSATTGYRCVNGESDGLPGLVADRYAHTLVVKLYTGAWLRWLAGLAENAVSPATKFETVILRLSRNIQPAAAELGWRDGQALRGAAPDGSVIFLENGLRFESDVVRGQKTGFFLDQRENRMEARKLAGAKSVLNLFSFSGGFSVAAAAGGAAHVVSLDLSERALTAAKRNFALNREIAAVANCGHETIRADAFAWLERKPDAVFDVVILDPPSLAPRESDRAAALSGYRKLIAGALARVRSGGTLVACSCSAHVSHEEFFVVAKETARQAGRSFAVLKTTGQPSDHKARFAEGEYLKAIYLAIR